MKTEAKKTLRTSPLSVSDDSTPFAPQQAYVYSFPAEVAFIFTSDVPCQFQIQLSFGFTSSTLHTGQGFCIPPFYSVLISVSCECPLCIRTQS